MKACIVQWPQLVRQLLDGGRSQRDLAEAIGVDQATICRLANGQLADVRFEVGAKLLRLAGGHVLVPEAPASAPVVED